MGGSSKAKRPRTTITTTTTTTPEKPFSFSAPKSEHDNNDLCNTCKVGEGELWLCDYEKCPLAFHTECIEARHRPNPNRLDDAWYCPVHDDKLDDKEEQQQPRVQVQDKTIAPRVPRSRLPLKLGAGRTVAGLLQHLELLVDDSSLFCDQVVRDVRAAAPVTTAMDVSALMLQLTALVGEDAMITAMRCLEEADGKVAWGLISPPVNGGVKLGCKQCGAEFRGLRQCCLRCGARHVVDVAVPSIPLLGVASSSSSVSTMQDRIESARRGIVYFESVCGEAVEGEVGDVTFLAYKLWTAMRGTALELEAKLCCERVTARFLAVHGESTALPESAKMADLLDTSEGLHVLHRLVARRRHGAADGDNYPSLGDDKAYADANSVVMALSSNIKARMAEFHLSDVCGFEPGEDAHAPLTPPTHCSNCSEENDKRATKCATCHHRLLAKFDYGSMTDAVVWCFVFGSIGVQVECQARSRIAPMLVEDVVRLLPETRRYRELDELGESFFKLQCYFLTHFIYVMSDWGEQQLKKEFYEEEYSFLLRNLGHVLRLREADPEIVGEFVHCLYILGYEEQEEGAEQSELDVLVRRSVELLLREETAVHGRRGAWNSSKSTMYDRYHAAWCGIVGLIPRRHLDSQSPQAKRAVACAAGLASFPARFL